MPRLRSHRLPFNSFPFGSRLSLKTLGLAVWNDGSDEDKLSSIILTPFAFEVAAALAAEAEHDASSFTDWTERAKAAMEDLQSPVARDHG